MCDRSSTCQGACDSDAAENDFLNLLFAESIGLDVFPSYESWFKEQNEIVFPDSEWMPNFVPDNNKYDFGKPIYFNREGYYKGPQRIPRYTEDASLIIKEINMRGEEIKITGAFADGVLIYDIRVGGESARACRVERALIIAFAGLKIKS